MAAKHAASAATQLINASGGAGRSNRNQASQQQLMSQCKVLKEKETLAFDFITELGFAKILKS